MTTATNKKSGHTPTIYKAGKATAWRSAYVRGLEEMLRPAPRQTIIFNSSIDGGMNNGAWYVVQRAGSVWWRAESTRSLTPSRQRSAGSGGRCATPALSRVDLRLPPPRRLCPIAVLGRSSLPREMRHLALLLAICGGGVVAKHVDLPGPYADFCILDNNTNLYDPGNQFLVPWFNIDLDADPSTRWVAIAKRYKEEIHELIDVLINFITPLLPNALQFVDGTFAETIEKFPTPYRQELISISKAADVPIGRIVLYNIFYEIFTVCTSVIGQDPSGNLVHARNLDFGLFLGWNYTTHEWQISQHLRKMILNVNWIRNGKVLFKSNHFAGYIGIYNALKPGAFSLTANERFMEEGGLVGILRWLLNEDPNAKWMTMLAREAFEQANTYAEAKEHLMNVPMLSPVYYILGGANPWEGAIITRSLDQTDLLTELDPHSPNGWYVLQTNYDQNTDPLYLDDRRTPGNKCMQKLTQKNVGFQGIYNVLSSKTNLNKLTTYTVLMEVKTGRFETIIQGCPGSCWPF